MVNIIKKVREKWELEDVFFDKSVSKYDIEKYVTKSEVHFPADLYNYFIELNGTNEEYDDNFYTFYGLEKFDNVNEFYKNDKGIPNFQLLFNTLENSNEFYVFGDYDIEAFSYAIRLGTDNEIENEVLVLCGGEYRKIASSFTEFLQLYLEDSPKLTFG